MRPLQAHCQRGLARLQQRRGDVAGARAQLTRAAELFRAMEMSRWLAPTEAELRSTVEGDTA
jgi:hypothetical protein